MADKLSIMGRRQQWRMAMVGGRSEEVAMALVKRPVVITTSRWPREEEGGGGRCGGSSENGSVRLSMNRGR